MRIKNILFFASISFLIGVFGIYWGAKSILSYQGHSFGSINHNQPAMLSKKSFLSDTLLQLSVLKETLYNHFFLKKNKSYKFYQDLNISNNSHHETFKLVDTTIVENRGSRPS